MLGTVKGTIITLPDGSLGVAVPTQPRAARCWLGAALLVIAAAVLVWWSL